MKFKTRHDELTRAMQWVLQANNPAIPAHAGVLIRTTDDAVELRSFEGTSHASARVAAEVTEPGECVVPGRVFSGVLKGMTSRTELTVSVEENHMVVKSARSRHKLNTMPDTPVMRPGLPPAVGQIDAADLLHTMKSVGVAAARDDTVPVIGGVLMEGDGNELVVMATDRYRVHETRIESTIRGRWLLAAQRLAKLVKFTGTTTIYGDENMWGVGTENGYTWATGLISGDYPAVSRLWPTGEPSTVINVNPGDLLAALHAGAALMDQVGQVQLMADGNGLTVESGGDQGGSVEYVPAHVDGYDCVARFNHVYLGDALKHMDGETVRIRIDGMRPVVIEGDDNKRALVMPVRQK